MAELIARYGFTDQEILQIFYSLSKFARSVADHKKLQTNILGYARPALAFKK